uniref:Uncharacterized protein n=1 Tax=Pavo cristatus TaxID=9049 RepID=A0A8C9EX46_PAVCR
QILLSIGPMADCSCSTKGIRSTTKMTKEQLRIEAAGKAIQPPHVISWTLSCCFLFSRSVSLQRRKFSSVSSALRLTVILSQLFHTSKPIKATRRPRG